MERSTLTLISEEERNLAVLIEKVANLTKQLCQLQYKNLPNYPSLTMDLARALCELTSEGSTVAGNIVSEVNADS